MAQLRQKYKRRSTGAGRSARRPQASAAPPPPPPPPPGPPRLEKSLTQQEIELQREIEETEKEKRHLDAVLLLARQTRQPQLAPIAEPVDNARAPTQQVSTNPALEAAFSSAPAAESDSASGHTNSESSSSSSSRASSNSSSRNGGSSVRTEWPRHDEAHTRVEEEAEAGQVRPPPALAKFSGHDNAAAEDEMPSPPHLTQSYHQVAPPTDADDSPTHRSSATWRRCWMTPSLPRNSLLAVVYQV